MRTDHQQYDHHLHNLKSVDYKRKHFPFCRSSVLLHPQFKNHISQRKLYYRLCFHFLHFLCINQDPAVGYFVECFFVFLFFVFLFLIYSQQVVPIK